MIYQAQNPSIPYKVDRDFDQGLIWSALLLISIGLIMIYSASIAIAEAQFGSEKSGHYLIRHSAYLAVGTLLGLIAFQVPIALWQKFSGYLFMIAALLLVAVLIPGIGHTVNGSQRWIPLYLVRGFAWDQLLLHIEWTAPTVAGQEWTEPGQVALGSPSETSLVDSPIVRPLVSE